MGKIWMPGGGGGADLDMVTAGKPDVLAGKVIVDKDGEPLTGTMPDRGAISTLLGINGTYTIPEGYHNGLGKVTQNIATMGGQTVNPTASQQIVSTNGKYLTGNVTVNGVSNLTAANIKKGVNVGGTTGTFEGYVPTANDLYVRGTNRVSNWVYIQSDKFHFETGMISAYATGGTPMIGAPVNLTGYNYLNVELMVNGAASYFLLEVYNGDMYYSGVLATLSTNVAANTTKVISLGVSSISAIKNFGLGVPINRYCYIYRIWLS